MDAITRNNIFIENMELINRTMHRHRLLLFALHLDRDDVYQELAIAALRAIESFDPVGPTLSKSISGQNCSTLFWTLRRGTSRMA